MNTPAALNWANAVQDNSTAENLKALCADLKQRIATAKAKYSKTDAVVQHHKSSRIRTITGTLKLSLPVAAIQAYRAASWFRLVAAHHLFVLVPMYHLVRVLLEHKLQKVTPVIQPYPVNLPSFVITVLSEKYPVLRAGVDNC